MIDIKVTPSLVNNFMYSKKIGDPSPIIQYLTGTYETSPAASRGIAIHEMIEKGAAPYRVEVTDKKGTPFKGRYDHYYKVDEHQLGKSWIFSPQVGNMCEILHSSYKNMIHEMWTDTKIQVGRYNVLLRMKIDGVNGMYIREFKTTGSTVKTEKYNVLLRMKIDGVNGMYIREFKTTGSTVKTEKYNDAFQWKAYFKALPEAAKVHYTVLKINRSNEKIERFDFEYYRPHDLDDLIHSQITETLNWIEKNGLINRITYQEDRNPYSNI